MFFFKKSVKISERNCLKTLALFFKDYFLPEKKEQPFFLTTFSSTPSPAILLLLFDSSQQCIPKSSLCQNANKQILVQQRIITHMYCQILTIPFVQLEMQKNISSDLISLHSAKPTCHSHGKVWLP